MSTRVRFRAAVMALAVVALWGQSFQRAAAQVPEENRKQLVEALGTPFIVFREKVLDELKVSDEQKEKLMQHAMEQIMETGPFLDSLPEAGQEREKKLNEHRKNAQGEARQRHQGSAPARTTETVAPGDASAEGGFALGQEDVRKELKITQEQLKKFMAIVQELQKSVAASGQGGAIGRQAGRDSTENRAAPQGPRQKARSRPHRRPEKAVERAAWPTV